MWKFTLGLLIAALPSVAHADWYKASSEHFVVYADDSPKDVAKFAEMLEKYHAAMASVVTTQDEKTSPSNRVTIFAVGSEDKLQKLYGDKTGWIQGYYLPRAGASRAFVQNVRVNGVDPDTTLITLLHEYAHHFMISKNRFGMPRWLSEGGAEFFASASFERDGRVMIGKPASHRAYELQFADEVPIRELLDEDLYKTRKSKLYNAFYGRSWLLYHYLTFSPERSGQLQNYWVKLASGVKPIAAAEAAFGNLDQLEKDLNRYFKQRKMLTFSIPGEKLPIGPIEVTPISLGMARMMPVIIRSQNGVDEEEAAKVVVEARAIAAGFPNDAEVQAALAEAEHDSGNYQAAVAAADRAIAADPSVKNAYIQKGYSLFRLAQDADDADAAYKAAMAPFRALNAMEPDHPIPLIYFYRSYGERGIRAPELARHAIERAAILAPFDMGLWMTVGFMQADEGKIAIAIDSLSPIANNPHGGRMSQVAQTYIDALAEAPEGKPFDLSAVNASTEEADGGDGESAPTN